MSPVIGDFIRNLVIIIFLNALLEMMLPQGGFHRYIRLITGLIVILLVVSTITALIGKASRLELVTAAVTETAAGGGTAAGSGEAAERQERVGAAYSRQVLQQCRASLEQVLREEAAAAGGWQVVQVVLILEEDERSSAFGSPLQVDLVVGADGEGGETGGGAVAPVNIAPVVVGEQDSPGVEQSAAGGAKSAAGAQSTAGGAESAAGAQSAAGGAESAAGAQGGAGAAGAQESAGSGPAGAPRHLPELEQSIAHLLDLPPAQVSVTVRG